MNLTKVSVMLLSFMLILTVNFTAAADLNNSLDSLAERITKNLKAEEEYTIAVTNFSMQDKSGDKLESYLAETLTVKFVQRDNIKVVERKFLNQILEEHQLSIEGFVDAETASKIGEISGADVIVTGSMFDLGNKIGINARAISTDSGEIYTAASLEIEKGSRISSLLGEEVDSDVTGEYIEFQDAAIEKAVRKKLEQPGGEISEYDVKKISQLDLSDNSIVSLEGLQYLTNLEVINLNDNLISDLSPLSRLSDLEKLALSNNKIEDIEPLANLRQLSVLYIDNNKISNIGPLSKSKKLKKLVIVGNRIRNITPLTELTNLRSLGLWDNKIKDISALSNLHNLNILGLRQNNIKDISPLEQLNNLETLSLDYSVVRGNDIPVSPKLNLLKLNLDKSKIYLNNELPAQELLLLSNSNKEIEDLILLKLDTVKSLKIQGDMTIDSLNISELNNLSEFSPRNISIKNLKISNLHNLDKLIINSVENLEHYDDMNVSIKNVEISNLRNITELMFNGAGVENISLSDLPALEILELGQNNIKDIGTLRELTNLKKLDLKNNNVSNINSLSQLTKLEKLILAFNGEIEDISPLYSLDNLETLFIDDVEGNKIDKLKAELDDCKIVY